MSTARSPNYPQRSLAEAVKFVEAIYAAEKTHAAEEEPLVQAIGYGTVNGKSRSALAALKRYGFLEKTPEGLHRLSPSAMKVLFPVVPSDRRDALKDAFQKPSVFFEMHERFGSDLPSDVTMRNYLMSIGFVDTGAQEVVDVYKESIIYVKSENIDMQHENVVEAETSVVTPEVLSRKTDDNIDSQINENNQIIHAPQSQTVMEDMIVKVSREASVHIRFVGEYSQRSIDVLIKYLEVMKLTFENESHG